MNWIPPTPRGRRPGLAAAGLLACAFAAACASSGRAMPEVASEINATLDPQPARFLPGDTLALTFGHDPNVNQSPIVDLMGNVDLLLVGTVNVAGKRPEEIRSMLEEAYKAKLVGPPDLAVNLVEQNPVGRETPPNRAIHVLGEVRSPGQFPFVGQRVTLIEALARAGGHNKATALLKNVLLVRWMPDQNRWRAWNIDARPDHWGAANQVLLQANDLVYVPNTPIDDVDIWVDQYIRQLIPLPYFIPPPSSTPR